MHVDLALSRSVAEQIGAQVKDCFGNSVRALLLVDELTFCHYVEGWMVADDLPLVIEHGWIETPDGRIVDVTLSLRDDFTGGQYFAGVRYSYQQVYAYVRYDKERTLPMIGLTGLRIPAYRAAYDRAHLAVYGDEWRAMMARCGHIVEVD